MLELLWPLFLFTLTMSITPGPNNLMVTASAANFGFRRTVPHMIGVTFGFPAMLAALSLGMIGVLQANPQLHQWLKYLGAAWMLYLAWRVATAGDAKEETGRARPITFFEAAMFQWVNPKAWVIAVGALTTYTTVGGYLAGEVGLISAMFVVTCFPSLAVWALFGTGLGRLLHDRRWRTAFNWTMAGLLVLSLATVLV
jgi:threonine/homoserine/homoserine lactone efflux protein